MPTKPKISFKNKSKRLSNKPAQGTKSERRGHAPKKRGTPPKSKVKVKKGINVKQSIKKQSKKLKSKAKKAVRTVTKQYDKVPHIVAKYAPTPQGKKLREAARKRKAATKRKK